MRSYTYVGIAERGQTGNYGLYFPDLPGCGTVADTLSQLSLSAQEALELHLEGMLESGETLPEPSPPDQLPHDPEVDEVGLMLVRANVGDQPSVVQVELPSALLARLDQVAQTRGITRSAILEASAEAFLKTG